MGECKLDHSVADVEKKLAEQAPYLPADLTEKLRAFLQTDLSQAQCNELFHLLKKYDLATAEEKRQREEKMAVLTG